MEDVFKLFLIRNAELPEDDAATHVPDTPLSDALANAEAENLGEVLQSQRDDESHIAAPEDFPGGPELLAARDEMLALDSPTVAQLEAVIKAKLQNGVGNITQQQLNALSDSILAIKLSRCADKGVLQPLSRIYQMAHMLLVYNNGERDATALRATLKKPLVYGVLPRIRSIAVPDNGTPPPAQNPVEAVGKKAKALDSAIKELSRISPKYLRSYAFTPPAKKTAQTQNSGFLFSFGRLFSGASAQPISIPDDGLPAVERLSLNDAGISQLSSTTQALLSDSGIDIKSDSLFRVTRSLENEKTQLIAGYAFDGLDFPYGIPGYTLPDIARRGFGFWIPPFELPVFPAVPTSHGSIQPVGVGEFLFVRQQLVRYEAGEVAHIENILRGELKRREHKRRDFSEEIFVSETEETKERERDLQSTERYEVGRESKEILKEEFNVKGGLKIEVKASPAVKIEVTGEVAYKNARETAIQRTQKYVQEVVDKSVERISERSRQEITRRIVNEVEETNIHEFNNVGSEATNVAGVYQWVDKVYQAQIFRVDEPRMIYDFNIPEPAAFLIEAMKDKLASEAGIIAPEPFELDASQILADNYLSIANQYDATDVAHPPALFLTRAVTFTSGAAGDSEDGANQLAQKQAVTVPDGYEAIEAHISAGFTGNQVFVSVGRGVTLYEATSGIRTFPLSQEEGEIPVYIVSNGATIFGVSVEIVCRRTTRREMNWQITTHGSIKNAYLAKLAEYENALEEQAINNANAVGLGNSNPDLNRDIERNELKKHCISILSQQHYDAFNSVELGMAGVPQLKLSVAEQQGAYIRFFEHAFEWELLSYILYPYFWSRKTTWINRIRYTNVDPQFAEFVQAGSARAVVPVRPGFEAAVEHFMRTGETWSGEPLPEITDEEYLPIVEEIRERAERNDEVPVGEAWEVRIPTQLIKLRGDDALPRWRKVEGTEWEWEAENPA